MGTTAQEIIKKSLKVSSGVFIDLVDDARELICRENGEIGNLIVISGLVKAKPTGEALVIGDLHGNLESLVDIFASNHFCRKLERNNDSLLIFLGDYGDRGAFSAEVYYTVLSLKLLFPNQVVLMRGNHEFATGLEPHPHDLPDEFQSKFSGKWREAYSKVRSLFDCLKIAVLVEGRYLLVHGGLPVHLASLEDLALANRAYPDSRMLEDLLWSDPADIDDEFVESPRGAGRLFGKSLTRRILEKLNVKVLIRGHEPCADGFKIDHDGRILTLFSMKGPPYFNKHAAYLQVPLSEEIQTAKELIPYIHQF